MIQHLESHLSFIVNGLWRASWQASVLAGIVLIVQAILGKRLGGRGRFALWAIVLLRLLLPVLPESRFSLFNLAQGWTRTTETPQSLPVPIKQVKVQQTEIPIIVIGAHGNTKPQAMADVVPAQPVPAVIQSRPSSHWVEILFAAWLAGVLILAIRVAHICWTLSRTIGKLSTVADPELLQLVRSCAATLHLRSIPSVLSGDDIHSPAVVGIVRPRLLLPSHVLAHCDAHEIRLIILHELAHLKRHDLAGNWLIALATVLHWFNPIVWLAASRMRADRELACDELVLSACETDAPAYGRTLLKLIELLSPRPTSRAMIGIVGILESTTPMQRRVRMIAQFDPKNSGRWIWTVVVLGLLGCVALTDAERGDGGGRGAAPSSQPATQPVAHEVSMARRTRPNFRQSWHRKYLSWI